MAAPIQTLGDLRQPSGAGARSVKEEIRDNLVRKLQAGERLFPGIIGFDETVIPQLVNAILSRHNFILLGLRGQAKDRKSTRLNSSHRCISYAVFCLKKKNNNENDVRI